MEKSNAVFSSYPPSETVLPFVHRYMYGFCEESGRISITIPPTGGIFFSYIAGDRMIIRIRNQETKTRSRFFIGGQLRNENPVLGCDGRFRLLGVELRPAAFYRLFHCDASRFTDCMTDFHDVFPRWANELENTLLPTDSTPQLILKIEQFLEKLIPHAVEAPVVEAAIAEINKRQGLITAEELSGLTGYSARQLHRYFIQTIGIPAKHYAKIVQINYVISSLMQDNRAQLQELSSEYGYFDQAHFIHDFQRFIQTNPTEFLRSESDFLYTYLGNVAR